MSRMDCPDPLENPKAAGELLETIIVPRARDLGGFEVRRALPSIERKMIGPFIFWDQMGPSEFLLGEGMDVRPHPHIGLSTITYLFQGEIMHRDSLGSELPIEPGALNWMTAGKGIVHSERMRPEVKAAGAKLFGIQAWAAMPADKEEVAPEFHHHPAEKLPTVSDHGVEARVILGALFGESSPVPTPSETIYADVKLDPGGKLTVPAEHEERGIYVATGAIEIAGDRFEAGQLLVFHPGDRIDVTTSEGARFMVLGGDPMEGERYIWWNFVSSSRDRIEQAKEDWKNGRFPTVPNDTEEFIPLPEDIGKPR